MKRRFRTTEERSEALRKAIDFLETDLRRTQAIRGFGRGYLWNYVRQKAGILISPNRLYDFYRDVFPEEVQKRREGNFKHRTDFSVPGPNFLWCLDGYEKLKRFGFQIYACIDAYSRCIIWFFIGRSATTAISTLKQFLRTIKHLRMRPFFTRSDHGVETPLWVAAQATLAQCGPAEITYEDADGVTHRYRQGDRIQSCHMYGPSTRNVRIESWWRSLRGGASDRWISFFAELASTAYFIEGDVVDQIALYAIYAPQIQDEFADFVDLWNGHRIRMQKNRAHVISGRPMDLYNTREVRNWGVPIDGEGEGSDTEALHTMLAPLEDIDIDNFLTPDTFDWCQSRLLDLGFNGDQSLERDPMRPFFQIYLQLRQDIRDHIEGGNQGPTLALTAIPRGGVGRYYTLLQQNHTSLQDQASLQGDPLPAEIQDRLNDFDDEIEM